jgi:hypothetical protein
MEVSLYEVVCTAAGEASSGPVPGGAPITVISQALAAPLARRRRPGRDGHIENQTVNVAKIWPHKYYD